MAPSKYSAAHQNPQGPGDARPTAPQIIKDEGLTGKLTAKTILITGCSSGIGIETARTLSSTGATLFLTARNLPKARPALGDILEEGRIELLEMDQSSLSSVRRAAAELKTHCQKLNVLICNAGIMCPPTLERTDDGFESQFGVNHLSHFLLFNLVKDMLLASSAEGFRSRVVMVSSSGHRNSPPLHADYNFVTLPENYSPGIAYGQSKTANVWMANHITRLYGSGNGRVGNEGDIFANSVMPGGIMTGLQAHFDEETEKGMRGAKGLKSVEQGAATTVLAAVGREWEGFWGKYLEDCQEAPLLGEKWTWDGLGYVKHAFDREGEERLWRDSLELVGVTSSPTRDPSSSQNCG